MDGDNFVIGEASLREGSRPRRGKSDETLVDMNMMLEIPRSRDVFVFLRLFWVLFYKIPSRPIDPLSH